MSKLSKKNKIIVIATCISTAVFIAIISIAAFSKKSKPITVIDRNGNVLVKISDLSLKNIEVKDESVKQYIDMVLEESIEIFANQKNCDENKAKILLQKDEYYIHTAFDATAFESCNKAYNAFGDSDTPFSAVVLSNDGEILSIFSSAQGEENYALQKTQPYSAFKPLSVYAPAIEQGVANWSSQYEDSPVKKIKSDSGEYVDWPVNGTGKYTYTGVNICEGIKLSLNTTAIRCLKELGVNNSISFLSENFNIDVKNEERLITLSGEEEVLANIGLGYLTAGVSPLELTGFYTIFADGGKYEEPYAVLKIEKANQDIIYEHKSCKKQVISEETAYIMNKLLQNTLSNGGTAEKARVEGVKIGGKTGTGSELLGNWFVGFTPEYCVSVWHGRREKNICAATSAVLISGLKHNADKTFSECVGVKELPYCTESGELLSLNCIQMEMGFYSVNNLPSKCKMHFAEGG